MSQTQLTDYIKLFARDHKLQNHTFNTSRLKLDYQNGKGPRPTQVTPNVNKGPIIAKMSADRRRNPFMNVHAQNQSLMVKYTVYENGLKGVNATLPVYPPSQSHVAETFDLDIGKKELTIGPVGVAVAALRKISTPSDTCVRLQEAEFEADYSLPVTLRGKVIFNSPYGDQPSMEVRFGDIIHHLKGQGHDIANRFQVVDQNTVNWTVGVVCRYSLTGTS